MGKCRVSYRRIVWVAAKAFLMSLLFSSHVIYGPHGFTTEQWSLMVGKLFFFLFLLLDLQTGFPVKAIASLCLFALWLHGYFVLSPWISISIHPLSAVIYRMSLSFGDRDRSPPWMFSNQISRSRTVHEETDTEYHIFLGPASTDGINT